MDLELNFAYALRVVETGAMEPEGLSAFVVGGRGNAGGAIVKALAKDARFSRIVLIGRREVLLPDSDPSNNYDKFEQVVLDDFETFLQDPESLRLFQGITVGFYALGVSCPSISSHDYRVIIVDYLRALGRLARDGGVSQFHYVKGEEGPGTEADSAYPFDGVKEEVKGILKDFRFPRLSMYKPPPGGILSASPASTARRSSGPEIRRVTFSPLFQRVRSNSLSMGMKAETLGRLIVANSFVDPGKDPDLISKAPNFGSASGSSSRKVPE